MSNQNQILVPVDFSEQSRIALSQSYNIAKFHNSSLTLLYVIDGDFMGKLKGFFTQDSEQEETFRKGVSDKLNQLADEVRAESGLNVQTIIAEGSVHDEIVNTAKMIEAVFIIMGTNGANNFTKKFIGSNAWRVINEAHCPVISIKGKEHTKGCNRILLPLDITRESRDKIVKAIELARYFNSEIALLSIHESSDEYVVNMLSRQMQQALDFITGEGVHCTGEMINSKELGKAVLDYAEKIEADLIMIISQQELDITEWFIGSAAQEIINHSEIPVLSIKPNKRKNLMEYTMS